MSISLTQLGILTSLIVLEQMTKIRGTIKNGRIDVKIGTLLKTPYINIAKQDSNTIKNTVKYCFRIDIS